MGKHVLRLPLPGYDANDTDPDHYALYASENPSDDDHILIKEQASNVQSVSAGSHVDITHGLGYVPMCFAFVDQGSGKWKKAYGYSIEGNLPYFVVTSTKLELWNPTGSAKNFKYYIFYDNVT